MKSATVDADAAWRHPAQVVGCWDGAAAQPAALLRYRTTGKWWDALESAGLTLLVTREYEHLLIALSVVRGKPLVSYLPLPHPSGIAVDRRRHVVHVASTRNPNQIYDLVPVNDALPRFDIRHGPMRPTLMPTRARMFPGSLYMTRRGRTSCSNGDSTGSRRRRRRRSRSRHLTLCLWSSGRAHGRRHHPPEMRAKAGVECAR